MSQVTFYPSNLISAGYKIYDAKIQSTMLYAFQYLPEYDKNYKERDFCVLSKYLRHHAISPKDSIFQFFEYSGRLRIADLKRLAERDILKILAQLFIAVFDLHCQKSIGRCFNIDNVIITSTNDILLMDFGFGSPLTYTPVEAIQRNLKPIYDYRFDLFLIGRIAHFLIVGHDIPAPENFTQQWNSIQQHIKASLYTSDLKEITISLLEPDPEGRINFVTFSKHQLFRFTEREKECILKFYHSSNDNLRSINQYIVERDQEIVSQVDDFIVPPTIQPITPKNNLIYPFEYNSNQIGKFLNFYQYKFHLLKFTINQLLSLIKFSAHISVILSHFALQKMYCITFLEFFSILKLEKWMEIKKQAIGQFKQTNHYRNLLSLVENYIYTEQEQMSTYKTNTIKQLELNFPEYKTKSLYKEVATLLAENCKGLTFEKIKIPYRISLNNLMSIIEEYPQDIKYVRLNLLILMNILINKIVNIELMETHFRTLKKVNKISEMNSPYQIDLFLNNATIAELNEQFHELQAIYYSNY